MHRISALALLILALAPAAAHAASLEPQNYKRAFAALDAGHPDIAYSVTVRAHDPVLNKVLRAYYMEAPGNEASFTEIAEFIRDNPDWPGLRDLRAMAEQKMPAEADARQVISWFAAWPPVTLIGFYHYIDAMNAAGLAPAAANRVRIRWIEGDFTNDELMAFYVRFGAILANDDHKARLDRLLWAGDATGVRRMYPLIDVDLKNLAEARLALAGQRPDVNTYLSCLPDNAQNDPGLIYERLRWLRRNNRDDEAVDILEHPPSDLDKPEAWWQERQIMARRAMDKHDYELAYELAANHGQSEGQAYAQAEFLAGWLALRFLNQPGEAKQHFEALYQRSVTPISRARGAYWLGRTYEALGDKQSAEQAYESAAALDVTFYGQLAATKLYADPTIAARPEPAIPAPVRSRFFSRDVVRAVERLHDIGEKDRARVFFKSIVDQSTERADFVLLSELAYQIRRPDLAIEAAKAANQKNILVAAGGFPVLDQPMPKAPEPAFTLALIRQESMFNPDAASPAGAHGLMQLMPHTAKAVAQKLGIRFKDARLCEPDYNLRLGTAFVQSQIESFNGSYVLALAGYNAGPARVREWMQQIGDPRDPQIDPIDWIELIPVPETRNYIQRIIENLQIYRARLNGGQAHLLILQDLRR
jgi:soluble lytic murein transglycosylase